jgi:hypothetical protein
MSSPQDPRRPVIVDLRRWREERDRRLRRAMEEEALGPVPPPDRIAWPFRWLALIAGAGFLACGGFLAALPLMLGLVSGPAPWYSRFVLLGVIMPLGVVMALFGVDILGRGLLGREWVLPLWSRLQAGLDRRARPLPLFVGLSLFLVGLGLWRGREAPALWEPLIYWIVGFLHIGLHESGHLLAVRGVRYTPRKLVAGPLTIDWEGWRRTVSATRDWRWLFGGNVWFSARRRTGGRDLAVCLAGPLANLLAVGGVLAVGRVLGSAAQTTLAWT